MFLSKWIWPSGLRCQSGNPKVVGSILAGDEKLAVLSKERVIRGLHLWPFITAPRRLKYITITLTSYGVYRAKQIIH